MRDKRAWGPLRVRIGRLFRNDNHPRRWMVAWVILSMCAAAPYAVAQTTKPVTVDGRIWDLTKYLHGTTRQVRDTLNHQCEELMGAKQQLEGRRASLEAHIKDEHQACLDRLHKSVEYRALVAARDEAERTLVAARHGDDPYATLDASSAFTKAKAAVDATEPRALARDSDLANAKQSLDTVKGKLAKVGPALEEAMAWRDKLIDAIRQTFRMHGPITLGTEGILCSVTPLKVTDKLVLIEYKAPQIVDQDEAAGNKEGIVTYNVIVTKHYFVLVGVDPATFTEGTPRMLDRNFKITHVRYDEGLGLIYIAQPSPSDTDELFDAILPLHPIESK